MVRRITENNTNNVTKEERIRLILNIIHDLENDDMNGITENILHELEYSEVYDPDHNDYYYELSHEEAVKLGYLSELYHYVEDDDDGYEFAEKYYGGLTDTLYAELEEACKRHLSTFSKEDFEYFFEGDEPVTPADIEYWIHH